MPTNIQMLEHEMRDRLAAKNVEIDRLRAELAAMCENHQAAVAHYRKRDDKLAKAQKAVEIALSERVNLRAAMNNEIDRLRAELAKYEAAGKGLLPDCEPVAGAGVCAAFQFARAALGKVGAEIAEADARANMLAANIEHWKDLAERAVAKLAAKGARITEFEARLQRQYVILLEHKSRAERAEAERDAMRELLEMLQSAQWLKPAQRKAIRAALASSPAGPDGRNLAVLYCMERAEEDVKLLREALEGMIAVAEGRFDGNPHADIDALSKARAALAASPAGSERDALQKVLHTIWENPTTASWILELIEASGAITAPQ